MALQLFNTLSGKVEEFRPLEYNLVRMYACGPTVYDYGHIGNFRTFVVNDVIRRLLELEYGPDRVKFEGDWQSHHVTALNNVSTALQDASTLATQNAQQQQDASS